jgi:hypothetical protein
LIPILGFFLFLAIEEQNPLIIDIYKTRGLSISENVCFGNMAQRIFLTIIVVLLPDILFNAACTQTNSPRKLLQVSGMVRNELLEGIPYVHILIKNKKQGAISDPQGLFSFVTAPGDTVIFSAVGYKRTGIVIPDTTISQFLSTEVIMMQDTVRMKEVYIFPWKTYEEFKQAVLTLRLPETDAERAQKNIEIIQKQIFLATQADADMNFNYMMREQNYKQMTKGQVPTYNILSPIKWFQFFDAIKKKKFRDPYKEDR